MSYAQRHTVSLTTTTGGAATEYTPPVTGRVLYVRYNKTDFANGVDFAVTTELTGQNVWTESDVNSAKTVYPVAYANTVLGVQLTASGALLTSGSAEFAPIVAANERVKIVIAQGGNTKAGSFDVVVQ